MSKTSTGFTAATILLSVSIFSTEQNNRYIPAYLSTTGPRKHENSLVIPDVEDIIRTKVAVLMPMLDDNKMIDGKWFDRNKMHESESDTDEDSETVETTDESDSLTDSTEEESQPVSTTPRNSNPVTRKHQKLRQEINRLLKIEPISKDTKTVVNDALDQIMKELTNPTCIWKNGSKDALHRALRTDNNQPSIFIPDNMTQTEAMKNIKEKWNKVANQYLLSIGNPKSQNDTVRREAFLFLTRLRHFVFDIHEDYKNLQKQYAMKCKFDDHNCNDKVNETAVTVKDEKVSTEVVDVKVLVDVKDEKVSEDVKNEKVLEEAKDEKVPEDEKESADVKNEKVSEEVKDEKASEDVVDVKVSVDAKEVNDSTAKRERLLRESNNPEGEETCRGIICSAELAEFLTDFYRQINETQSEIFRNYIQMYLREIDTDNKDKESFTKLLQHLKKNVEKNVKKRYAKETAEMGLIPNPVSARIHFLKRFVDKTIENIREMIKTLLTSKLKKLPAKLRLIVRRDIQTTVNIELGNIQNDFKSKMCKFFQTCNGEGPVQKNSHNHGSNTNLNSRVKLGVDKKTLRSIADKVKRSDSFSDLENYVYRMNNPKIVSLRKINQIFDPRPPNFDNGKYDNVKITRSTLKSFIEEGTTRGQRRF